MRYLIGAWIASWWPASKTRKLRERVESLNRWAAEAEARLFTLHRKRDISGLRKRVAALENREDLAEKVASNERLINGISGKLRAWAEQLAEETRTRQTDVRKLAAEIESVSQKLDELRG